MKIEKNIKTLMACRYCPMCKQVCTSGNLSRHESDFPRGRGLILYKIFKETAQYDSDIVDSIYNCFLCGCCTANCEGGPYSMPDLIKAARMDIVNLKMESEFCKNIKKSISENDNPYGASKKDSFKFDIKAKAEVLYYMGPEVKYNNQEIAESVVKILHKAKIDFTILEDEPDCGKILSLLGYESDAEQKAKTLYEKIKNTGCKTLVVSCPLCYDAFKNDYDKWGSGLEPDIKIYHISEYLLDLSKNGKIKLNKTDEKMTIADSEYLGIFNDVIEAPRELLQLSVDDNFIEMTRSKRKMLATGEGAFIFNGNKFELGKEICRSFCELAQESGVSTIITLSATAKNNIKKCSNLKVKDIAEFVNEAI